MKVSKGHAGGAKSLWYHNNVVGSLVEVEGLAAWFFPVCVSCEFDGFLLVSLDYGHESCRLNWISQPLRGTTQPKPSSDQPNKKKEKETQ